ncbi:MAG: LysE family translocator [Bacteroidota bacterium]
MELLEPVWKGLITGLMFTLTFGTVFFSLIQTSVKRGLRQGLYIAGGVLLSDSFYISVAVLGSSFIVDKMEDFDHIIRAVGFSFLLILGIRSIIKKEKPHNEESQPAEKKGILYMMKGIMLNSINPMVLIAWLGVATYVETVNHFNFDQVVLFFTVVLIMMFSSMFSICYFARKLKDVLSPANMHRLNIFSGMVFILFSIIIIWPVVKSLVP